MSKLNIDFNHSSTSLPNEYSIDFIDSISNDTVKVYFEKNANNSHNYDVYVQSNENNLVKYSSANLYV